MTAKNQSLKDTLPVVLNVYKIFENTLLDNLGIGIYHTAIEYDNTEFAFGYIDLEGISGVYDIKPLSFEQGIFVESINLGELKRRSFFINLDKLKRNYLGKSYNFLTKNCNHFTNDFCKILFKKDIPNKYKSFLEFGELLRSIF